MGETFQVLVNVNVWETRKLYGNDSCPNQLQSWSLAWGLGGYAGVEGQRDGKLHVGKLHCVCCRPKVSCMLVRIHV